MSLIVWLAEAGRIADEAAHPTTVILDRDRFVIQTRLHRKNPFASGPDAPSIEEHIDLRDLAGLQASPFPAAIRTNNRKLDLWLDAQRLAS